MELGLTHDGIREAPALVAMTHCHPDHLEAALVLKRAGCRLAMHQTEIAYLEGEGRQLAAALGMGLPEFDFDATLEEGEFTVGDQVVRVIATPGHSPGHVCFHLPAQKALVSGDLVFAQGVGRVDFPGGDAEALKASVRKVAGLDLELLLPGHGPILKGAENIRRNFEEIQEIYFRML